MTEQLLYAFIGAIAGLIIGAVLTVVTTERTLNQQRKTWARDKLYEAYSSSIYYLFKLGLSIRSDSSLKDKDARQQASEAQRFLHILAAYLAGDKNFQSEFRKYVDNPITEQSTLDMLKVVKAKLQADDRIIVKL